MVVGGGETQQELIPLKYKEWSAVDLVLSELTVTEQGRRQDLDGGGGGGGGGGGFPQRIRPRPLCRT